MKKIIANVASYRRTSSLVLSIKSLYNQVDVFNVALNDHQDDIPELLYDSKINLFFTDNSKGDGFKFLNLINSDGYFFTFDDDLIYPDGYVKYMISKCNEYNDKSIITLHGRNFGKLPISSYYKSATEIYSCLRAVKKDVNVQYGGTGVMCFNTDLLKIGVDYFLYPNMADVWIGKYAKENNIPIICAKHDEGYIKYIEQKTTIYGVESKNDIVQTRVVNGGFENQISIIIPTFNNEKFLQECLNSVIESVKNMNCEILVGVDFCEQTKEYIKKNKFDNRIKFYYFHKNSGPYIVKNTLVKEAKSEIILFFDSDDIMKEEMINEIYSKMKHFDFIKPMFSEFQDGKHFSTVTKTNKYGEGVFSIKKSLFLQMNGFEPWRCAADSDFMGRLYKNNKKFTYTNSVVFYRRVHSSSLTQSPETSLWSKMRANYSKMSKSKKTYGPLPNLVTESFDLVYANGVLFKELINFVPNDNKKEETLNKIFSSKKPKNTEVKEINYNVINQVTQNKGVYIPKKNIPIRENKPNDRNKLIELKKGENNKQIKELFKSKPNRRNNLPNIF